MKRTFTVILSTIIILSTTAAIGQTLHKPLPHQSKTLKEKLLLSDNSIYHTSNSQEDYGTSPSWANVEQLAEEDDSTKVFAIVGLEVDNEGNSYSLGYFKGDNQYLDISFDGSGIFLLKRDVQGSLIWHMQIENSSLLLNALGNKMVVNEETGDVLICGNFEGTIEIDSYQFTSIDGTESFIASFDENGSVSWAVNLGAVDGVDAIALDSENNAIVSGTFTNDLTIGNTALINQGSGDVYLMKITNTGTFDWISQIGGSDIEYLGIISLDNDDNIYMASEFYSRNISFDSDTTLTLSETDGDVFLSKYTSNGEFQWTKIYGGSEEMYGRQYCWPTAIQATAEGEVYITGWYGNGNKFGDTTLYVESGYSYSKFVSKYDNQGDILWVSSIQEGTGRGTMYNEIDIDDEESLYIGYDMRGTITINNIQFVPSSADILYAKYTSEGDLSWVKTIPGNTNYYGYAKAIAMDVTSANNLMVSGIFYPTQSNEALEEYYTLTIDETDYTTLGTSSYLASLCGGLTDAAITQEDGTLIAPEGVSFQWYLEEEAIEEATEQTLSSAEPGNYYVEITTKNGCVYNSDVIEYTVLGTKTISNNSLTIYPNPSSETLTFNLSVSQAEISILDLNGKEIFIQHLDQQNGPTVNISTLKSGIYFIKIKTENGIEVKKFIKE